MIVSIHQPDYIPYLGYFYKVAHSDAFVFLDNVQFSSSNMHNWNTIVADGKECRLKIPVAYHFGDLLTQVRCKYELGWVEKHLDTIQRAYKGAAHFEEVFPVLEATLKKEYASLAELNIALNTVIAQRMDIRTPFVLASDLKINGKKEELVIDICRQLGADGYLSGNGAKNYQSEEHFLNHGITLSYTDYQPFAYPQGEQPFLPNMSIVDFLMNCGWCNPF